LLLILIFVTKPEKLFHKLAHTSESLIKDSELIPDERKQLLIELGIYIKEKLISKKEVSLIFICTHNSRRSHMAQIWAQAAAKYIGIENIKTYSGGTQKTAFNESAVNALKKAGFKINVENEGKNPKYNVRYAKKADPLICFSKTYDHRKNPNEGFVAIMTCSDADEACPIISGADYRTTIKYDDPKKFDGTDSQEEAYLERSEQIGREMFYVFEKVSELLSF
jgi:protein-tyrosine-phosphatase